MSEDPLSRALQADDDPYGVPAAQSILKALFEGAHPSLLADATGTFLQRLTLLEMYVEEELKIEIDQDALEQFRSRHASELEKETAKLAQLFYGQIATREGG